VIAILLPWLLWLTTGMYTNKQAIAINTANDLKQAEELTKIYKKIDDSENRLQTSILRLGDRFDLLMSKEIELLKEALKK
jgi:hypothetical protein